MRKIAVIIAFILVISSFNVYSSDGGVINEPKKLKMETKLLTDLNLLKAYDENAIVSYKMLNQALSALTGAKDYATHYFPEYSLDTPLEYKEYFLILLDFLGYGDIIANSSDDSTYFQVLKNSELAKAIAVKSGAISMDDYVQVMYNFLNANFIQINNLQQRKYSKTSETVMERYYNANRLSGVLTSTSKVSINSKSLKSRNYVEIDGKSFYSKVEDISLLVGYKVFVWINSENEVISLYEDENRNNVIIINAENLRDVTQTDNKQIKYYENQKLKTVKIGTGVDVVYGGTFYEDGLKIEDLKIINGYVKLIDNDNDDVYDVVFIENFISEVVDTYSPASKDLRTKDGVLYDVEEYLDDYGDICDINGKKVKLDNISVNNVVSIRKNKDGQPTKIILSTQKVSGIFQELMLADAQIVIGHELFNISRDRVSKFNKDSKVGDDITAYLDSFGNITHILPYITQDQFGYVIAAKYKKVERAAHLLVLTAQNVLSEMYTRSDFILNGDKTTGQEYYNQFVQNGYNVIKFSVDSSGKIKTIETARNEHSAEVAPKDYFALNYDSTKFGAQPLYVVNGDFSVLGSRYALTSKTLTFHLPVNGEFEDYYATYGNVLSDTTLYSDCKIYNVNEDYEVGVLTVSYTPGESVYAHEIATLVTQVSDALNSEGDQVRKIDGYKNGNKVSFISSRTDIVSGNGAGSKAGIRISDVKVGSMIQVGRDHNNEVNALNVLYTPGESSQDGVYEWCDTSPRGWYGASQFFFNGYGLSTYGKVLRRTNSGIVFNGHKPETGEELFPVRKWDRYISLQADVNVTVYYRQTKVATKGTISDITTDDYVFIQISESRLNTIVVYKD